METSQLKWIDTHCHLYAHEFEQDRDLMIKRALESGVQVMLLPNIDMDSIPGMLRLNSAYPGHCLPMMGLHPCSVKEDYKSILDNMKNEFESGKYIGIGETGIDLYWDTTYKKEQIEAFEWQLNWAREKDLPVVIHSRESLDLNIDIVTHHQDGGLKGIFHCFSGTTAQVKKIEKIGFKVGIGGVVTFKKSGLKELLPFIPRDMIVLETDSPYLAPMPYRGKRNESSYLIIIAQTVADSLQIGMNELSELTQRNALSVFGIMG